MKRMALLFAGGALWLLLMAAPTFADGGPHTTVNNNGSTGLAGDCAACHRAHQSTAADLLKSAQPGLCLSCHNGTGATADVVDGVQFVPASFSGHPLTDPVLGALRGGGFSYDYIDTAAPYRLSYNSRGGITVTFASVPAAGNSITLTWASIGTVFTGPQDFTFDPAAAATTVQAAATTFFGTSTSYRLATDTAYMSGLPVNDSNMVVTKSSDSKTWTFAVHNEFRLYPISTPSLKANTTGVNAVVANGISIGQASAVGVQNTAQAVTSTHLGAGTVWGNGPMGSTYVGATGVTLECTNCHNPHGNGMYRILDTLPGEDWASGTGGVANWTDPTNDVEVIDGAPLTGSQVHNYTVRPGYLATDVVSTDLPDYFRYKWDPSGATNFTNFYLLKDPMNSGWNGQTPTNAAAIESIPNTTLNADLVATGSAATSATVASTTGYPTHLPNTEPQPTVLVQIDSEILSVSVATSGSGFSATSFKVSRGLYGTTAVLHSSGATVTVIGTGDSQDTADYALYNNTGRMTAFCIACHTRYNGWAQNGTSSLNAQTPTDSHFTFKHGTTSVGCEQCHVNHGTSAAMSGPAAGVTFPDGTVEDSALLKVNNRGTCQLCHDPTETIEAGFTVNTVPTTILNP